MYIYDEIDQRLVDERVAQFRDQTRRFLAGKLSEDEFRPLRLRNGLYIQRYAPMLRIAIPYGLLSSRQLRKLAHIARTLRPRLRPLQHAPEPPAQLAEARGRARHPRRARDGADARDPDQRQLRAQHHHRPFRRRRAATRSSIPFVWCEILRQWSTFHPEFAYLPRKFKIAVNGATADRAAICVHDIGLQAVRDDAGEIGFRVLVGGGLGRTPIIGHVIREFLPWQHLLTYLEAILRVYNRYGRRDNMHKARIKILVKERGAGGIPRGSRSRVGAPQGRPGDADRRRRSRASRRASRGRRTRRSDDARCSYVPRSARPALRRLGASATSIRTRCRATPR